MLDFPSASQEILDSLEPDNVEGYTVAYGDAFTGIKCKGFYTTWEEAVVAMNNEFNVSFDPDSPYGDVHIVVIWKP